MLIFLPWLPRCRARCGGISNGSWCDSHHTGLPTCMIKQPLHMFLHCGHSMTWATWSPFTGPIASCDGVGDTNASLLMRTARADGILLKPDRPAVAIDALWIGDIFKAGR